MGVDAVAVAVVAVMVDVVVAAAAAAAWALEAVDAATAAATAAVALVGVAAAAAAGSSTTRKSHAVTQSGTHYYPDYYCIAANPSTTPFFERGLHLSSAKPILSPPSPPSARRPASHLSAASWPQLVTDIHCSAAGNCFFDIHLSPESGKSRLNQSLTY